jgi:uncharacterized membrane protein
MQVVMFLIIPIVIITIIVAIVVGVKSGSKHKKQSWMEEIDRQQEKEKK